MLRPISNEAFAAALLFCLAVACASTADDHSASEVAEAAGCIEGGDAQDRLLSLTRAEADSIVRLDATTTIGGRTDIESCTGIALSENWVLTALHCIEDLERTEMRVTFGEAGTCDGSNSVAALEFVPHASLDLCLLRIQAPVEVVPLEYGTDAGLALGLPVEISGFGTTDDGSTGRRFAVETVSAIDETSILVSGGGLSGACRGDSGGPLLMRSATGDPMVLGVLSQGSADCAGTDGYVRLSAARDWIDRRIHNGEEQ